MANRGWYAQKMAKLQKCKIAEMKERAAVSAVDYDNMQEDWANNYDRPNLQRRSEAPKQWKSLGAIGQDSVSDRRAAIYKNALIATLLKAGFTAEEAVNMI